MNDLGGSGPLSLLSRRLPPGFERLVVLVPAGCVRTFDNFNFGDARIEVEQGAIELEFKGGERLHFGTGGVLWMCGLPPFVLRSGHHPAMLVSIRQSQR